MKKKIDLSGKFTAYQINNVGNFFLTDVYNACDYIKFCKHKGRKAYEEITDDMRFKWFLVDVLHETVVCDKSLEWGLKRYDAFLKTITSEGMKEYVFYTKLAFSTLQVQYAKYLITHKRAYPIYEKIDVSGFVFDEVSE